MIGTGTWKSKRIGQIEAPLTKLPLVHNQIPTPKVTKSKNSTQPQKRATVSANLPKIRPPKRLSPPKNAPLLSPTPRVTGIPVSSKKNQNFKHKLPQSPFFDLPARKVTAKKKPMPYHFIKICQL